MTLNVSKEFEKKYGKKVFITADQVFADSQDAKTLPVVPMLDVDLGGGIKEGTLTLISGDEKTCKSSVCLHMCKNGIDQGRPVAYFDTEYRLKDKQLSGIYNLEKYRDKIYLPKPEGMDVWSAEKWLDMAEMLMKDPENRGMVLIIDSVSSLIPKSELEEDVSGKIRPGLPKTLSHFCKKVAPVIPGNDIILVMIRHFISDTGPSQKTKVADCGRKLPYYADNILNVKYTQRWLDKDKEQIGHQIFWDIQTTANGGSNIPSESWLRYGIGIDETHEWYELAKNYDFITGKTWQTLSFLEHHLEEIGVEEWDESKFKFQGSARVLAALEENPLWMEIMRRELKDLLLEQ